MSRSDLPAPPRAGAALQGLGVSRSEAAALGLLALCGAAGLALLWWLQRPAGSPAEDPARAPAAIVVEDADADVAEDVVVHVAGLVHRPGLHRLPLGARVADALEAAGGPRRDAWLDGLNLARPLNDGEQLVVPGEPAEPGAGPPAPAAPTGLRPDGRVDLNLATAEELETLPGVGPVTAQRILEHREEHGPFTAVGQLRDVPGIGEKTFQSLADLVGV